MKYKDTYAGRKLLEQHSLNEEGVWEVFGEDPNCDWGGPHHEPYLGTYKGTLGKVLNEVTKLPSFWTWGYGGTIKKISSSTIKTKIDELIATLTEDEIKELKRKL